MEKIETIKFSSRNVLNKFYYPKNLRIIYDFFASKWNKEF